MGRMVLWGARKGVEGQRRGGGERGGGAWLRGRRPP